MTESALRCCLRTSSVSCGSAACDCADRAGLGSSSRWQRSLKTFAGWPSSWHGRLRSRPHAWRERQVTPKARWQPQPPLSRASGRLFIARRQPPLPSSGTSATKICQNPTFALQQRHRDSITSSARGPSVCLRSLITQSLPVIGKARTPRPLRFALIATKFGQCSETSLSARSRLLTRCRNGPSLSDELMWLSPDR